MYYHKIQQTCLFVSCTLALFIFGSVIFNSFARHSVLNSSDDSNEVESENNKEGYFELNNFDRFEVKQGELSWRIKANKARYFSEDKLTQIVGAVVNFNRKDGSTLEVLSQRAKIFGEDKGAKKAELEGDVKLAISDGISVFGQYAVYDSIQAKITLPDGSVLKGNGFEITGQTMDAFTDSKFVSVRGEVKSKFEPNAKLPKKLNILENNAK